MQDCERCNLAQKNRWLKILPFGYNSFTEGYFLLKRITVIFAVFVCALYFSILVLFRISDGDGLAQAAAQQQNFTVTVASRCGTIYDHNLDALAGDGKIEYPAAVAPCPESAAALRNICNCDEIKSIGKLIEAGKPFTMKLPQMITAPGIDVFPVRQRYSDSQIAVHVLGYLDSSGNGETGVEQAFNSQLSAGEGSVKVTYCVDAMNHVLSKQMRTVSDSSGKAKQGIVLTLDRSIQQLAERSAAGHIKSGAVVVLEVPSGKIRAAASFPAFSPNNIERSLNRSDSPLINRAYSAYSVGSVFKIVSSAAALEYGISPDESYVCTGSVSVDGQAFHCYKGEKHGKENMERAIVNSCNTYFVNLMRKVPPPYFLSMAQKLGFGRSFQVAPGIETAAGVLPTSDELKIPRALANFSFGQGNFTATPLQVAGMVNAVASGGIYTQPYLYEGMVDDKKHFAETAKPQPASRVMSARTASLLQKFMEASVKSGTSKKGKPDYGTAGAKTSTAQTGKYTGGKEKVESWYAGFYPAEKPKYVIAIFEDGGDGGGTTCGPVFRSIADGLYGYVY